MDSNKQYQFATKLWNADSEYRDWAKEVVEFTRQRYKIDYKLNGREYRVAPSPRAFSLVQMFAAFPESIPRIEIPPVIADNQEDEKATHIERFLRGVRRATQYGHIHPDDAFWIHYAEVGRGILYCQFDLDLAKEGKFPFHRKAIDPLNFAFKMSDRGLVCAVTVEERDTLELYDELYGVYERVKDNEPEWGIPDALVKAYEDYDSHPVKVTRFWDREREYMWVDDAEVWRFDGKGGRPHLMGRVPFDVGFCAQMPGEKPAEWGNGIVKYVLGNLKNRSKMLDKAYLGFEFFFLPHIVLKESSGRVFFEQVTPGGDYPNIADTQIVNPTVNAPMLEQLLQENDTEISLASLSDTTQSGNIPQVSGYLFSQANSGPQRKNDRLLDSGTDAYRSHFNLILNRIEEFANEGKASEFGLAGEVKEKYLSSFSTFSPMPSKPNSKIKTKVTLKSQDVKGYQVVEVDFKPEPPQDENAKYQRAQLAKPFMPQEFIDREVLKVESPEQVAQWRKEEMLMQDPEWQARMLAKWKKDKLNADEDLAREFQAQDIDALPLELAQRVRELMAQGVTFTEAMDWAQQQIEAQTEGLSDLEGRRTREESAQTPQPNVQTSGLITQPAQTPAMTPEQALSARFGSPQQRISDSLAAQVPQQLPPEIQPLVMQLMQQGLTFEQAIQYLQELTPAGSQPAQGVPSEFVSPTAMGQAPVSPEQAMSMQGF